MAKILYDAFPTRAGAVRASISLKTAAYPPCAAVVRKLRPAQGGGRLKFGVYVPKSCKL